MLKYYRWYNPQLVEGLVLVVRRENLEICKKMFKYGRWHDLSISRTQ